MILGFYEMPDTDRPPQEIWHDEEAIAQHFQDVKERRNSGMEPIPDDGWMEQNELTKSIKRR